MPSYILGNLNKLREQSVLPDITVHVQNCEYNAHQIVLAASSDYFRAMLSFNQNLQEVQSNSVTLYSISAIGFELLLNYIYASELNLSDDNVQDVLEASVYLQVDDVIDKCAEYLETCLNPLMCVDVLTIAETFNLEKVRTAAYKYICGNLSKLTEHDTLYQLFPVQVENILKFDLPVDCTETHVLCLTLKWLFSGTVDEAPKRLECIPNILRHIRYEHITPRKMDEILENIPTEFSNKFHNISLYEAVLEYVSSIKSVGSDLSCSTFNSRGMEVALVKIGGFQRLGVCNDINFCFINQSQWEYLTNDPDCLLNDIYYLSFAVLDNSLYTSGRCLEQPHLHTVVTRNYKYNPRLDEWTQIKPMQENRHKFTLTACDGKLYAVAGVTQFLWNSDFTNSCECFDPSKDSWEYITPLPDYTSRHAAVAVSIKGVHMLYISGGTYKGNVRTSMHCFDTNNNSWTTCASMKTPRASHFMFGFRKKIYVCGGYRDEHENPVSTIDAYDCLTDTWEVVTEMPNSRYHAAFALYDSKIYIVGGLLKKSSETLVDCYNIVEKQWTVSTKAVQDYIRHGCATLYIPKSRNKMKK